MLRARERAPPLKKIFSGVGAVDGELGGNFLGGAGLDGLAAQTKLDAAGGQ